MREAASRGGTPIHAIVKYFRDFGVLRDNPPEFWAVQAINLLDQMSYFAMISIATVFLTRNVGWGDVPAGYIVTALTMLVTISLIFGGFLADSLGVRKALLTAAIAQLVARLGVTIGAFADDLPGRGWIVAVFLVLGAPGLAMTQSAFQAANRRFSSERSRSASFNVWYLVMNIGAATGGFSIDLARLHVPAWLGLPTGNPDLYNPWLLALGTVLYLVNALVAYALVRPRLAGAGGEAGPFASPAAAPGQPEPARKGAWRIFREVTGQTAFWRFLTLMGALLGVRAVFLYLFLLMPKYWTRVIGEDAQMGSLQSINPILIVVGLVFLIPIANRFNVFNMLVGGAIVSSLSLLVLVVPWQFYGATVESGYYWMSAVMLIVMSVGEVVWSPKLQEYTAAIAPVGQEGSYFGMSLMPWFFAKLVISAASGHMLVRWCPEGVGEQIRAGTISFWDSPEAMWLVLFAWAIVGPAFALLFRGWLTAGAKLQPSA